MIGANTPWPAASASNAGASIYGITGGITALFGALGAAVGTFYALDADKTRLGFEAKNRDLEAYMGRLNASAAERDAQAALEAGRDEDKRLTMAGGAERASFRASTAGRGVVLGQGSAAEAQASLDLIREMDRTTIHRNSIAAAEATRRQGVNYRAGAGAAALSAANARASARSISPGLGFTTSLVHDFGALSSEWAYNRERARTGRERR